MRDETGIDGTRNEDGSVEKGADVAALKDARLFSPVCALDLDSIMAIHSRLQ